MTERQLVPLPNKDLWRGHTRVEKTEATSIAVTVVEKLSPLDQAFKDVVESAKGGPLNCLWCGQQFSWLAMREHLDKNHATVTHPMADAEVALHQAAANQTEAAKAE
jgi:hypothetical protein